jgi:hypothetical protein
MPVPEQLPPNADSSAVGTEIREKAISRWQFYQELGIVAVGLPLPFRTCVLQSRSLDGDPAES